MKSKYDKMYECLRILLLCHIYISKMCASIPIRVIQQTICITIFVASTSFNTKCTRILLYSISLQNDKKLYKEIY